MDCCGGHENNKEECTHENCEHEHGHEGHNHEGHNHGASYTCPMHPEVKQEGPGRCPKCGMDLVKDEEHDHSGHNHSGHDHSGHDHSVHDHASMMASPQAAADFLKRFWIVTAFLVPLLMLTRTGLEVLGIG